MQPRLVPPRIRVAAATERRFEVKCAGERLHLRGRGRLFRGFQTGSVLFDPLAGC